MQENNMLFPGERRKEPLLSRAHVTCSKTAYSIKGGWPKQASVLIYWTLGPVGQPVYVWQSKEIFNFQLGVDEMDAFSLIWWGPAHKDTTKRPQWCETNLYRICRCRREVPAYAKAERRRHAPKPYKRQDFQCTYSGYCQNDALYICNITLLAFKVSLIQQRIYIKNLHKK